MTRADKSLSELNEDWIQSQIDSKRFSSRREVLNDLVRQAREREPEYRDAQLMAAEEAIKREGWALKTSEDMIEGLKVKARELRKL